MSLNENNTEAIQELDLVLLCKDFFKTLQRMWRRVLALTLLGGILCAFWANMNYQAYYTASATYTINIREEQMSGSGVSTSFYDNSAAEQMATTFPYILTSGVLQRRVAEELGLAHLPGVISASVAENTNLLTIAVRDVDPERAYETLQAVLKHYPEISEVIVGKVNMRMLDETGVPTGVDNPKNLLKAAAKGGIVGIALGAMWAVLVTFMRKTIRREEDCIKYVNQRCLGVVPLVRFKERSKRRERHLNIMDEMISPEFRESVRMIRNKVERSAKENSLKTILITSALAGEGKSTIAVNLALSFVQEGKKVALVDCDLRNPSDSQILGLDAKKGLVDYLNGKVKLSECICTVDVEGVAENSKLFVIPGGKAVADGSNLIGNERVGHIIDKLEGIMDYVILDSAPVALLTDAGVLAQHADGGLFIIKKDFAKAGHILRGMEHLAESDIHMIGCVLNGDSYHVMA